MGRTNVASALVWEKERMGGRSRLSAGRGEESLSHSASKKERIRLVWFGLVHFWSKTWIIHPNAECRPSFTALARPVDVGPTKLHPSYLARRGSADKTSPQLSRKAEGEVPTKLHRGIEKGKFRPNFTDRGGEMN